MRRETYKMAVIGAAAAGLGAVLALLQHDVGALVVLDAMFRTAASLQNQKWLQSGCFYLSNPILALKLWEGFQAMVHAAQPFLLQRGAHFVAVAEDTLRACEAVAAQCGIPLPRLTSADLARLARLGPAQCIGGFLAPDSVINFPAFLAHLRERVATKAHYVHGTVQRLVRDGDRIVGAIYRDAAGEEVWLYAETYILCAGAWTVELLADIGMTLPVTRWQSHILRVEDHHLVDRITAWLDGPRITMVPYWEGGRPVTLIANAGRVPVETLAGAHIPVNQDEVELLLQELAEAFPRLDLGGLTWEVYGCLKTEFSGVGLRNQDMAIFDTESMSRINGGMHDFPVNLVVGFPGKASSMLRLGEALAERAIAPQEALAHPA